jgi:hypothetical protein
MSTFQNDYSEFYEYPEAGGSLKPGEEFHDKLVQDIMDRAKKAKEFRDKIVPKWKEFEHNQSAYLPDSQADAKQRRKHPRSPINIVVPFSFQNKITYMAFMANAFFGPPILRIKGQGGPKQMVDAALWEIALHRQCEMFRAKLALCCAWSDSFVYGRGIVSPSWAKRKSKRVIESLNDEVMYGMTGGVGNLGDTYITEEDEFFEGCDLISVDQHSFLDDPNTPTNNAHRAQFKGYHRKESAMDMLRREQDPEEQLFNCRYFRDLCKSDQGKSCLTDTDDARTDGTGLKPNTNEYQENGDVLYWYEDIIPRERKLGPQNYPVRWMFKIGADQVLLWEGPLNMPHEMYPFAYFAPTTNGYDVIPTSLMAMGYPAEKFINFTIDTWAKQARKSLFGVTVLDPEFINYDDVMNPEPGKVIRMDKSAYGNQGIEQYLKIYDQQIPTGEHIATIGTFMDFMSSVMGTKNMQGDLGNMPERPGQIGMQMARSGAIGPLQLYAAIMNEQAMKDITWQMCFLTQRYMSQPVWVDLVGSRRESQIREEYMLYPGSEDGLFVSPQDVRGLSWSIEPQSALTSGGDMAVINNLMERMMSIPEIAMATMGKMNIGGMFAKWARDNGWADVHDYMRSETPGMNVSMMPDQQLQQQAQAGNMVPVQQVQ